MKSVNILLNSIEKVKLFVTEMNIVEGDVIVGSDQQFVNAKSIMGIFSLDLSRPLELKIRNWKEEYVVLIEKYLVVQN